MTIVAFDNIGSLRACKSVWRMLGAFDVFQQSPNKALTKTGLGTPLGLLICDHELIQDWDEQRFSLTEQVDVQLITRRPYCERGRLAICNDTLLL